VSTAAAAARDDAGLCCGNAGAAASLVLHHFGPVTGFRLGPFQFTATKPGKAPVGLEEARRDLRTSRPNRRTWTNPTLRQSPQAREGRSPGSVRRHKDEVTAGYVAGGKRG